MKTSVIVSLLATGLCALPAKAGDEAAWPKFWAEFAEPVDYHAREAYRLVDAYGLEGNAETVRADLERFMASAANPPTKTLFLRRDEVCGHESYRIDVAGNGDVTLTAGDDDGIRRAACFFEDRVQAGDLKPCVRKPWLRNRISRCFFGPIKRPPFNRDELMDDVDYYPEAYLDRLAHEGVNGLWLTVSFADLARTDHFPVSPTRDRRLAKLRQTVARCARYGVRTWLFFIEPCMTPEDAPFFLAHPDARGCFRSNGRTVMCPSSPAVRDYLEQATRSVFAAVPGLGGAIAITHGERMTTCLSRIDAVTGETEDTCPACSRRAPWQLHQDAVGAMARGMRTASPDALFISWFYQPQPSPTRAGWVGECARHLPEGVVFQCNFESGAEKEQLGKVRHGGDYWLSYVGPSRPFRAMAAVRREAGGGLSAKIQVGCSHEVATVPYVPAPGLLYRKYREMRRAGVTDVMQCWYFGNCPGTMNAAAGALAFEEFADDEQSFLLRLARPTWGEDAPAAVAAWESMTSGYMEYPLSNQMQYYGPVHAGLTWPLIADIEMKGLPRSWMPQDTPRGDLIGECLEDHAIEEAITLFDRARAKMRGNGREDPLAALDRKIPTGDRARRREVTLMRTLRNQFESARDILEFYRLRAEAVSASRDRGDCAAARQCLAGMRKIVAREDALSRETAVFAESDSRLGYHSESEDHRFDAGKLLRRAEELKTTLARLDQIDGILKAGRPWPESAHERAAPRWTGCRRDAAGALVIEGVTPDPDSEKDVTVYLYDVCGTAFVKSYSAKVTRGRFTLTVPPSEWGGRASRRPGWIMVDRFDDYWQFNGRRWPQAAAMTPEKRADLRLRLWGIDGDCFGRLVLQGSR